MPNAILRAGPFATSSDSFVDEPGSATESTVPVNCAMNNWASDDWKLMSKKVFTTGSPPYSDESITYVSGPTVSQSTNSTGIDPSGFTACDIQFEFTTQAAVSFDIKVSATASATVGTGSAGFEFSIINETTVSASGSTFSNSQTVTIQPSVLPRTFRARITAADAANSVSATLSVEPA